MIPTPDLSHLTAADYDNVYEPAEDTFILLDALEQNADVLRKIDPLICLEIGSGSGCVSTFLHTLLTDEHKRSSRALLLCTDINPLAVDATLRTGSQNKASLNAIQTSFALPLSRRLHRQVDVLIFNPPYVPTPEEEAVAAQSHSAGTTTTNDGPISGAWAGGEDGMSVTNVFLEQVEGLLSPQGRFYLVAVARNNVPRIIEQMQTEHGLSGEVVLKRKAGRELLHVIQFIRAV